jgi:hypothetical protein
MEGLTLRRGIDFFKGKSNSSEMVFNISTQKPPALTIIFAST